jgi:hypothetical protein
MQAQKMNRLIEIKNCTDCPNYKRMGSPFRRIVVNDDVGNTVHLNFDEYTGYCKQLNRIILKVDIENGFPIWCCLPLAEQRN